MTGLEFAAVALIGVLVGRFLPNRRKTPEPVRPVCGCGHHHSYHDLASSECHATVRGKAIKFNAWAEPMAWDQIQCSCKQYSGPVPLPEYFAPEVTTGDPA